MRNEILRRGCLLGDASRLFGSVLLTLILSFLSISAMAFEVNGLLYEILDDTSVRLTGSQSDDVRHLYIPSMVVYSGKSYRVNEIGSWALAYKGLESVTIPEGVESIMESAFCANNLTELILPQSLKELDESAFNGNDLKSANVPPLLSKKNGQFSKTIFVRAGGNDNIIDVVVIEESDTELDTNIGTGCGKLVVRRHWSGSCAGVRDELTFEGVDVVDVSSFRRFDVFPAVLNIKGGNVRIIRGGEEAWTSFIDEAFKDAYEFKREDRMKQIPYHTNKINIECGSIKGGVRLFSNFKEITSFVAKADAIEFDRGAFAMCDKLSNIDLTPFNGIEIGMFQGCTSLTELTVTPGCRFICGMAFYGCSALEKIKIEKGGSPLVVGVGAFKQIPIADLTLGREIAAADRPFCNIRSLRRLTLRDNISELPDYAFAGCTGLREIYCESSNPPVIYANTFKGVSRTDCKVYIRDNENAYREFDGWKDFFSSVESVEKDNSGITVASNGNNLVICGLAQDTVAIYDMQGREVVKPVMADDEITFDITSGYYIIVAGGDVIKYVHK